MRKLMSALLACAMGMLLSGCFTSEFPKFPLSSAVASFGDGGRYVVFEHIGSGEFRRQGPLTVKRMPDGSYEFERDGNVLPISFHQVGNGVVVAQARDKKFAHVYLFLTRKGAEMFFHLPQCDQQDQAMLSAQGVVHRDKYECSIDKVADPAKLFMALIPGEPTSKIVLEK
jgi:hypothetical protein